MLLDHQHAGSRRFAEFEDDDVCAFLYITKPGERVVAGDCWLYNRIPAPDPAEIKNYRGSPPPAVKGVAGPDAQQPTPESVEFLWSNDGNAVAVLLDGTLTGFVIVGEGSFSRHLVQAGPWGSPWDEQRFQSVFGGDRHVPS